MITAGQRRTGLTLAGCVLAALGLTTTHAAAMEASQDVQAVVKTAIEANFPGATIKAMEPEREHKVVYYDVEIAWKGKEMEVEVATDGALGEVTQETKQADLPAAVAAKVKELVGAGKLKEIELTEVRGVPKGTTFAAQTPVIVYEIKYKDAIKKKTVEARLGADGAVLVGSGDDNEDDADDDHDGGGEDDD